MMSCLHERSLSANPVPAAIARGQKAPSSVGRWPKALARCHNIMDLRELAYRRLPAPIFHYLDGGSEAEHTLRRNTSIFDTKPLIPRCLVDVSQVDTRTVLFGRPVEWPVICSPTGASRFFHPHGELAVARAAAATGTPYSVSTMSTYRLEDIAAATSAPKLFQLYVFKDRKIMWELVERAKASGYSALCLTVDSAVPGKRERDLRTGWGIPIKLSTRSLMSFGQRPRWVWGWATNRRYSLENFAGRVGLTGIAKQTRYVAGELDASVTWPDVVQIIRAWGGPFAIKGIMSVADALRARDAGATAVIVSNHGGRQLDGAISPLEVLPEIARAVGSDLDVILDGGVRRGAHIVKALASGAKACAIGRPYLYGLSAAGEAGVRHALTTLKSELVRAMKLCGCRNLGEIGGWLLSDASTASSGD